MLTYELSLEFSGDGLLAAVTGDDFADGYLRLASRGSRWRIVHPRPSILVALWGAPALDDKIDDARVAAHLAASRDLGAARDLNGAFVAVVYDAADRRVAIVNDRFGARPFFYCFEHGKLRASSSFKPLFDARGGSGSSTIDPDAIFEFVYFRRVFGDKTYDRAVRFLPYASILTLDAAGLRRERYWQPRFERTGLSLSAFGRRLAEGLRQSVALYTSDAGRFGLMLSGGLDARAILAASRRPLVCFTNAPVKNNEWAVASELAAIGGGAHMFLPRPERFVGEILDGGTFLGSGMTIYTEAQFANYEREIASRADSVMLGLALDIMFCGHYLPKSHPPTFGRPGWEFRLHPLGPDLVTDFVETVSYRLKTSDPFAIVRADRRRALGDHLRASVAMTMDEGRACGAEAYDLWEFMHLHNFGRHYSFLMAASIEPYAAARMPSMENGLYDLVCTMPVEYKANWRAYQRALTMLSPRMMAVRNANTNIRASYPLRVQTAIKIARAAANRIVGTQLPAAPAWWDRSWPEARQSIDANPAIREAIEALPGSERLMDLSLFDQAAIRAAIDDHFSGRHDHSVMLNLLLTVDRAITPQAELSSGRIASPAA